MMSVMMSCVSLSAILVFKCFIVFSPTFHCIMHKNSRLTRHFIRDATAFILQMVLVILNLCNTSWRSKCRVYSGTVLRAYSWPVLFFFYLCSGKAKHMGHIWYKHYSSSCFQCATVDVKVFQMRRPWELNSDFQPDTCKLSFFFSRLCTSFMASNSFFSILSCKVIHSLSSVSVFALCFLSSSDCFSLYYIYL